MTFGLTDKPLIVSGQGCWSCMSVAFFKNLYLKNLLMQFSLNMSKMSQDLGWFIFVPSVSAVRLYASFNTSSRAVNCWEFTFPCFLVREIDFVKKEEELKKIVDEKDKWYKQQLENLEHKVRKNSIHKHKSDTLKTKVTICCVCRCRCWSPE